MFKQVLLTFCFFLQFHLFLYGQDAITIKGKLILPPSSTHKFDKAYLGFYKGKDFKLVDSSSIKSDQTFILKTLTQPVYGMYEITLSKEIGMPLIITAGNKKPDVLLKFSDDSSIDLPEFNNENKAFSKLTFMLREFNRALSQIQTATASLPRNKSWKPPKDSLNEVRDTLMANFNRDILKFKQSNSGTYASDVMANLLYIKDIGIDDIRTVSVEKLLFMREHFFDGIPFRDERVLYNPLIYDKIFKYVSNYSAREVEGFKKCADVLMGQASANPKVKDFALQFLLDVFIQYGPEKALFYVSDNYMEGCANDVSEVTVKRIKQMRNFKPGTDAPALNLPDTSGKMTSLHASAEGQPILLYFWSSNCTHCREETPKYVQLYKQVRNKGLKVYAVSLDEKKEDWTETIRNMGLDWINVCDYQKYNSPAAKSYYVFATPSVFLIDEKGKLILVNPIFEEVAGWVNDFFR